MRAVCHVLFVVEYYSPHVGGGEIVFQHLAEGLAARGVRVDVVTCRLPGTAARERRNGVMVHRVRVPRRGRRHWFSALALPTVLRLCGPDTIIHTTTHNGAFPAWLGARLRGVPCVQTVHEVFGPQWAALAGLGHGEARLFQRFERAAVSLPFAWQVCVSQYTKRKLEEYYPSARRRVSVIYNGVDHALFDPAKVDREAMRAQLGVASRFVALYFGRPGYAKGLDYLLDALPELVSTIPNFLLMLLLADEPRNLYEQALARLQPFVAKGQARIMRPVAREALPAHLAAADCVVIPSLSEGFGLSAAEACAMGRPVVATTGGALPEVVSGQAVLVEPRDAGAISAGVRACAAAPGQVRPPQHFGWEDAVAAHWQIYAALWRNAGVASGKTPRDAGE